MLKQSILAILLCCDLPYIINYHEHLSYFMQLCNRMTAQLLAFPLLCDFERQSVSLKLESYCRVLFCLAKVASYPVWNNFSISFNKRTVCGNRQNFIHIGCKAGKKSLQMFLISHATVKLNEGKGDPNWNLNVEFWYQVWKKSVCKYPNTSPL